MSIDTAWLDARIAATQLSIEAYEAAEAAIGTGGAQSYTLDTGQSRQTVTKANITEIRKTLDSLYARYSNLCNRRNGGQTKQAVPGW